MTTTRRTVLAGLAATVASPALAQFDNAIRPQNDPWAQVDPYADPRNGFPLETRRPAAATPPPGAAPAREAAAGGAAAKSPTDIAKLTLAELLADPESVEIGSGRYGIQKALAGKSSQGAVIRNQALQGVFRRFCEPFLKLVERPHLPWELYLTDSPTPNGLAYGGGKITVAVGSLIYADHPAEFASIVVHEIGHNDRRHLGQAIETDTLMKLLESGDINAPGSAGEAFRKLDPMYDALLESGFSRLREREADAYVPFLYDRMGMDTGRQIVMFQKMMKVYDISSARKTCLMDSHPAMQERIELLRPMVRKVRNEFAPPGWEELKRYYPTPPEYRWG